MIVDTRETELYTELIKLVPETESKTLELGDISMDEYGLVFERKTLADLQASIKDGRYREQGYRLLNSSYNPHNVVYIVEGNFSDYKYKFCDKKMLFSAMASIHAKGFSVMRTSNVMETAFYLSNLFAKRKKLPLLEKEEQTQESTEKNYAKYVNKTKNKNITENNIHEIMLMQIPSISDVTARHLIEEFKTIGGIIECVNTNPSAINEFKYPDKNGKMKKMSKAISENIIRFLGNNLNPK
uniref:ERCC4 domain-containing protein n=1 Tax=viral metagenome TaxID=1070528 RepID=A0A6C0HS02_9ZZZZ